MTTPSDPPPSALEIRHLRLVRAVAEAGSVSGAARALGLTQPNVAGQLSRLERRLGGRLFDRGRDGVRPTAAGAELTARAERILHELDEADLAVSRLATGRAPALRLRSEFALAGLVQHLLELHPQVRVEHVVARLDGSYRELVAGAAGFVQGLEPPDAVFPAGGRLRRRLLVVEPMWAVLPAGHRLAGTAEVRLRDLADERWVARAADDPLRAYFDRVCAEEGFRPAVAHSGSDHLQMVQLVRSGCVGLGSPVNTPQPGIVSRPLAEETVHLNLVALWRTDLVPSGLAEDVVGWITAMYEAVARRNNPAYWSRRSGGAVS
jgi:molybdate transport repressor ModE-like protein